MRLSLILFTFILFSVPQLKAEEVNKSHTPPYFPLEPKNSKAPYAVVIQVKPCLLSKEEEEAKKAGAHMDEHTLALGMLERKSGRIIPLPGAEDWPISNFSISHAKNDDKEIEEHEINEWAHKHSEVAQDCSFSSCAESSSQLVWSKDYQYIAILYSSWLLDWYYIYSRQPDGSWRRHHLKNQLNDTVDHVLKKENVMFIETDDSNYHDLQNTFWISPDKISFDSKNTHQLHLHFISDEIIPIIYHPAAAGITEIGMEVPNPLHMDHFQIKIRGMIEIDSNSNEITFKKESFDIQRKKSDD